MKKIIKGLSVKKIAQGQCGPVWEVNFNGKKCEKLGAGASRVAYRIPDENYVVKIPADLECTMDQTHEEFLTYKEVKARRQLRGQVARVYQPFNLVSETGEHLLVGLQEFVDGKRMCDMRGTTEDHYKAMYRIGHIVEDAHDENFVFCKKRNRPVLVDLGCGLL